MRRREFGAITDGATTKFLHEVRVLLFFITIFQWCQLKIKGNWSYRRTYWDMDVDMGTWRSCCWMCAVYLVIVPEILALVATMMSDEGYDDLAYAYFWDWVAYVLITRSSEHVRVTLKTLRSPLRCIFGQCIHVSRVNPVIMGPFYWWWSIVKFQQWAKREASKRSKTFGGNWYSLGIQSRSKN